MSHPLLHLELHFTLMAPLEAPFFTCGCAQGYICYSWLHSGLQNHLAVLGTAPSNSGSRYMGLPVAAAGTQPKSCELSVVVQALDVPRKYALLCANKVRNPLLQRNTFLGLGARVPPTLRRQRPV